MAVSSLSGEQSLPKGLLPITLIALDESTDNGPKTIMSNNNSDLDQGGLETLPENERVETQKILDEIKKDEDTLPLEPNAEQPKPEIKPEPAKPEEKVEPKVEEAGNKKPDDEQKPEEKRRDPKFIPAWVHEVDKAAKEKEILKLQSEIERLTKSGNKAPVEGEEQKGSEDSYKDVDAAAEKAGIDKDFARTMYDLANKNKGELPEEVANDLKAARQLREDREIQAEEVQFSSDFDSKIVPLIKAEYGDDVPQATIAQIKGELKAKAYTKEYAQVPYSTIYKGEDQFRDVIAPLKKGAENGRGGTMITVVDGARDGEIDLTKPLLDDVLKTLTDEQFEKYSDNMAKYEQSQK